MGKRHQLGGIGPYGNKQQPGPALLHNRWWEPKVVSSNYYARVHSNRPLLCRSLQKRSPLAPSQSQGHHWELEFGGELSCTEVRAETFLLKTHKSTLIYASPKNRKTSLLDKDLSLSHHQMQDSFPAMSPSSARAPRVQEEDLVLLPVHLSSPLLSLIQDVAKLWKGISSTSCVNGSMSSRKPIRTWSRSLM